MPTVYRAVNLHDPPEIKVESLIYIPVNWLDSGADIPVFLSGGPSVSEVEFELTHTHRTGFRIGPGGVN